MTELSSIVSGRRAAVVKDFAAADHRYYDFRSQLRVRETGDWLSRVETITRAWLDEKSYLLDAGLPAQWRTDAQDVFLDGIEFRGAPALRLTMVETAAQGEFRTEVLAVDLAGSDGWIGVTVHSTDGNFANRPRLVPRLLEQIHVRDGASELVDDTWVIDKPQHVQEFLHVLADKDRLAPVFVTAVRPGGNVDAVRRWMAARSRELAGLAHSYVLSAEANASLMHGLGPSLGVQPGTIRSFANGPVPHDPTDALRHRVIGAPRLERLGERAAANLVGRIARFEAAVRDEPTALRDARRAFDREAISHRFRRPISAVEGSTLSEPQELPSRPSLEAPEGTTTPVTVEESTETQIATGAGEDLDGATHEIDVAPTGDQAVKGDDEGRGPAEREEPPEDSAVTSPTATAPEALAGIEELLALTGGSSIDDAIKAFHIYTEMIEDAEKLAQETQSEVEAAEDDASDLRRAVGELELELSNEIGRRRTAELNARLLTTYSSPAEEQTPEVLHPTQLESPVQFSDVPIAALDLEEFVEFTGDIGTVEELDVYDQYNLGAKRCWEGLIALHDYVRARREGVHDRGFWDYLQHIPTGYSGFPFRDFAAVESESTMSKREYRNQRLLPVPETVDPTGRVVMWAHLKLSQVGRISPRLHFHDDVARTGKVYVGYIGRHLGISSG
ncbi:hypothetical protein [Brachybacterium tyrofermentans]|uniref:hypothetical protein n=1 Tax=Brachybacterium tyrofermentans TaxID=47848 RepID=UPI003FD5C924